MAISLYSGSVPVCLQLLGGLKTVLQKAEDHATAQKWDTATVLNLRLYPDMFTLERQVRQVCNHALGAGRVAGVALPSLPDQDHGWADLQSAKPAFSSPSALRIAPQLSRPAAWPLTP